MISIYVGMALSDAPEEFRVDFQNQLKAWLRMIPDIEVKDFFGLGSGTAGEVYALDRHYVLSSDLMIAIMDHPSLGLGGEVQLRVDSRKPLLPFRHNTTKVSRYPLGAFDLNGIHCHAYHDISDIVSVVRSWCNMQQLFPHSA